jgi:hypothetical protein
MLACVSPADSQFAETRSTLEFAGRASAIVNKASKNEIETIGEKGWNECVSLSQALFLLNNMCVCVNVCAIHIFVFYVCVISHFIA